MKVLYGNRLITNTYLKLNMKKGFLKFHLYIQGTNLVLTMTADAIVPNNAKPSVDHKVRYDFCFHCFQWFHEIFFEQIVSIQVAFKLRDT